MTKCGACTAEAFHVFACVLDSISFPFDGEFTVGILLLLNETVRVIGHYDYDVGISVVVFLDPRVDLPVLGF